MPIPHPAPTNADSDEAREAEADAMLDRVTAAIESVGFGDLIAGTSGGGCPIAVAGPMLAAHWAQLAWNQCNETHDATAERNTLHAAAIDAWALEADGAGNFPEAMHASARAWALEASTHH